MKFIEDFKDKHGRYPEGEELSPFLNISTSAQQLEFYKNESMVVLEGFLSQILSDDLKEREVLFSHRVHSELKNIKPRHYMDILKCINSDLT